MTPGVLFVLGLIVAGLAGATIFVRLKERGRAGEPSELRLRIRTWWWMVGVLVAALLISRTAMIVLLAFVSFLALKEYFTIAETRRADRAVLFWAYLAIPVQYLFVGIAWYGMFIIFVPVYMFLVLPAVMVLNGETRGFLRAAGSIHWGLMTTVFAVSHAAYLLAVPPPGDANGAGLLVTLLILTEVNDVAQYVFGKRFGHRKIVPNVSPNKTWAGFLGGVGTTAVLSVVLCLALTPVELPIALLIGVLLGIAGFVGDLTVSAVKRDLDLKDTGSILPGHGGILDRIDSLTFTAPLFFHIVRYFYY
ncbi:phosphatidate cytidylyltransferase [Rhodobium orientis]|uniref:Phosphatidate cytidylyltransferase n=1 Tax=Rhodobium orientis TaxID=34017 RepID=A0A327JNP2_9HYPH|nr:phosphatidate cytidylyltransferase [Rhodobium orientis]MBK5950644.1 phosphatidate cytidylyltransferase [Rhodobium orientis]RAI28080.1 phosphatidate cytidylyltransferase [Rhodobium orientis]